MTNKMPVVGQRYRHKKTNSLYRLAFGLGYSDYVAVNEQDSKNTFFYSDAPSSIKLFWENFEELPTSNLQENEEVQDISICFRCGKKGGIDSEHNCNRFAGLGGGGGGTITPNPVDLEKGEVNEVERALEELKKELFHKRDCHFTRIDKLENLAQNLVNALEADKTVMSKPEPKIDMKEERVEPVSIWKDVSESIYHCNFSPDQLCLYESSLNLSSKYRRIFKNL